MAQTMPKELKRTRVNGSVEWNPQVLDDWMLEQSVGSEWVSQTIGKNKLYLYNAKRKGRISKEVLDELHNLTGIAKEDLKKEKEKKDVTDWKKPEGVNESKVGYWEFRGIKTDENGNPIFEKVQDETEKTEPETNAPEPKRTMPDEWVTLMGIDSTYYVRKDEIVQVRRLLNGSQVLTKHGTFSVIEDAFTIMERLAE